MTNKEKAREIAKNNECYYTEPHYKFGELQDVEIDSYKECEKSALEMAGWKDQQLEEELNLISDWFKHIAQMADDKKTLNGAVMKDSDAFDEIKCLAKRCAEYIDMKLYNK